MKKTIILILLALVVLTGWAQRLRVLAEASEQVRAGEHSSEMTKVWNNVVVGYTNVAWSEVTKVKMYPDRTEVGLRIKHRSGSWIAIAKATYIEAGSKQYPIKEATVIGLDNRYALTTDVFDFTLVFDPVPFEPTIGGRH